MSNNKGKLIYQPSGKANEYASWACNLHTGCTHMCDYCYLAQGILAKHLGGNIVKEKITKDGLYNTFNNEVLKFKDELLKYGLFFSFSTDPLQKDCIDISSYCMGLSCSLGINVTSLTKTGILEAERISNIMLPYKNRYCYGSTLTGYDYLEPYAAPHIDRIISIETMYLSGFKTFVSLEPVISVDESIDIAYNTQGFVNHYKVGLLSGCKYQKSEIVRLINGLKYIDRPIYYKESIRKYIGSYNLPENSVERNYNIF